ncbi:hypothetical protein HMPREF1619_02949 [Klebsiella pneumoniae 909957]|nr:hypothetical protein HMPREF1619_02949 [Klebsiella pneumoniae 909957]
MESEGSPVAAVPDGPRPGGRSGISARGCVMIHPFDIAVLEPGDQYAWRPDYGTLPQLTLVLRQVLNCENPR